MRHFLCHVRILGKQGVCDVQKNYFDSWPKSWILLISSQALQMGIFLGPHKYDNALIWISLHLNMLLILNLVLMPTNDNEARSESTNHSVPPPLWERRRRQLHKKQTHSSGGNFKIEHFCLHQDFRKSSSACLPNNKMQDFGHEAN